EVCKIYAAPEYGCSSDKLYNSYFIVEASFSEGLNSHLYVTYRFIIADLVTSPFAYFLERRKIKAKDDTSTGSRVIFALSHRRRLNHENLLCKFEKHFSNIRLHLWVSSLTFVIAIVLRMEEVDVRSRQGIAKILGTLTS
ncbi:hypothetical protein Gohar_025629, partial [Gossypium harknessii]|nr:hypothetical protein [Gossypium harknessii]